MSNPTRPYASNLRHTLGGGSQSSSGQSSALVARIDEKRAELENLKQLRDLSAGLATQMETLEQKLSTLSNGTEAVAVVLSNWHNVLRAINLASAHIPRPKDEAEASGSQKAEPKVALPQTLVRIPVDED